MLTTMPTKREPNLYTLAALVSITVGALVALALHISTVMGSETAANTLLTLTLPKYNPFALLIPEDLSQVRLGMEMMLGVVILEVATVLFALSALAIRLLRKR